MTPLIRWAAVAAVPLALTTPVAAQLLPGPPLRWQDVQRDAAAADPRLRQLTLLESQSALRLRNLAVQWLPLAAIESQVQYQTDAPTAPLLSPSGLPVFSAPKQTYDLAARLDQRLYDPGGRRQTAVERAQLAEQQARVRTTLYAVRQQVNDAFFAAALLQQRARVLAATAADLERRLQEATARVREGTLVRADAAAIEAALLQRRQDEDAVRASLTAALDRLSTLVGRTIPADAVPVVPDLAAPAANVRAAIEATRSRPEYELFERTRDRIARQRDLGAAQSLPTLSAFARVGYGRPGLDFIEDQWQAYGVGGVRLQWNAWNWGATSRERDVQSLQQQIVAADEAAFTRGLAQSAAGDLAVIDHLARALATDQRIIDLRADVEQTARARLEEGVLTPSDYLARDTELLQARIAQATHEVELAQARARLLTTLGVEVP